MWKRHPTQSDLKTIPKRCEIKTEPCYNGTVKTETCYFLCSFWKVWGLSEILLTCLPILMEHTIPLLLFYRDGIVWTQPFRNSIYSPRQRFAVISLKKNSFIMKHTHLVCVIFLNISKCVLFCSTFVAIWLTYTYRGRQKHLCLWPKTFVQDSCTVCILMYMYTVEPSCLLRTY